MHDAAATMLHRWDGIIQFKFICIALFTIQSLQSALQEIKFLQYIYTLQKLNILTYGKIS